MKKIFKRITAAMLAAVMAVNVSAPVCAETISDYEAEITENGKTVRYETIELTEASIVTDPVLLEQLNSLTSRATHPATTWPNAREYDLTGGSTYMERVNIANGDYHSPFFLTDMKTDKSSKIRFEAIFHENQGVQTYYLNTTVYLYTAGVWSSAPYNIGINEVIYYKILANGTANSEVTKVCFRINESGSHEGLFTLSVRQT